LFGRLNYLSIFCCKSWSATWQNVEMLLTEGSAYLNEYCFIIFFSDIDVHNELFNGFRVFSTLKVSRHQNALKFIIKWYFIHDYDFKASTKKSNCFLYKW
jgi:hypothetical protein